jgi:hypothetical protein
MKRMLLLRTLLRNQVSELDEGRREKSRGLCISYKQKTKNKNKNPPKAPSSILKKNIKEKRIKDGKATNTVAAEFWAECGGRSRSD